MHCQAQQFAARINLVFPTLGHANYCVKKTSKTSLKHRRLVHFKTDCFFHGARSFVTMSFWGFFKLVWIDGKPLPNWCLTSCRKLVSALSRGLWEVLLHHCLGRGEAKQQGHAQPWWGWGQNITDAWPMGGQFSLAAWCNRSHAVVEGKCLLFVYTHFWFGQ